MVTLTTGTKEKVDLINNCKTLFMSMLLDQMKSRTKRLGIPDLLVAADGKLQF